MNGLSTYAKNKVLDHIFGNAAYTPASTLYLGYSTADPLVDGSGIAEPTGGGYSRKAITFGAAASRQVANNAQVVFDQATGSQGTITHWFVADAATAGNMLAWGAFDPSKTIVSGNQPTVDTGRIVIGFQSGKMSNYLANKILDFVFRNQTFTQPTPYMFLATATVTDASTGSTITEPSGNGYERVQHTDWDAAASGALANTSLIAFPTATGSWGEIVYAGIVDAASAGNILFYDDIPAQTPSTDDVVRFPIGDADVVLQNAA